MMKDWRDWRLHWVLVAILGNIVGWWIFMEIVFKVLDQ